MNRENKIDEFLGEGWMTLTQTEKKRCLENVPSL